MSNLSRGENYFVSEALSGASHGFFGRQGGVSQGELASLNCGLGSGDDPDLVRKNRQISRDTVAPGSVLLGVHQYHSAEVAVVDQPWQEDERPKADAIVTRLRGVSLAILTADCAPVLFYDPFADVIGAAHAGWRGAAKGVIGETVKAMVRLGADPHNMRACVGPCIAGSNYEVGEDMRTAFAPQDQTFFSPGKSGHYQFDLAGYVESRLRIAEVAIHEALPLDTYGDAARFYSYRRATHRGESSYGRQISLISLGTE